MARSGHRLHSELEGTRRSPSLPTGTESVHPLLTLQQLAGNKAVTQVVQRDAGQGWTFSITEPSKADIGLDPQSTARLVREAEEKRQEETKKAQLAAAEALPKVRAWLETQRSDIESRATSTKMGLLTNPKDMVTMPKLVDLVRINVPDAKVLDDTQLKDAIRTWAGFDIVDVALVGNQVPLDQMQAMLNNMLGTPGKVKVQRRGDDFIEVNLESTQITAGPAQVSAFWEGGVGLQIQPRENVAGSFQVNADGTWKAQLVFGKSATPPVANQMYNVWSAAHGAAQQIARSGKSDSLLQTVSGPVKDAVDTLNSISSKEEPKLSVSVTASGGPGGGVAVEAALTYRF